MDNRRNIQNIFDDISNLAAGQSETDRSWYEPPPRRRYSNQHPKRQEYRRCAHTREKVSSKSRENE